MGVESVRGRAQAGAGEDGHGCVTVALRDVSICLGDARIIRDVSLECCEGEWIVLTGPSGAGKSTLLRTINGLCPPSNGRIFALGSSVPERSRRQAREVWRRTGTVLQEIGLFETRSARANVELALRAAGHGRRDARRLATEWLTRLGLGDKLGAYPWRLSGGERQRVALARALAPCPELLILDEPTSSLDRDTARVVLEAIKELVDRGTTVVMSSHRPEEAVGFCDRQVPLLDGRLGVDELAAPPEANVVRAEA